MISVPCLKIWEMCISVLQDIMVEVSNMCLHGHWMLCPYKLLKACKKWKYILTPACIYIYIYIYKHVYVQAFIPTYIRMQKTLTIWHMNRCNTLTYLSYTLCIHAYVLEHVYSCAISALISCARSAVVKILQQHRSHYTHTYMQHWRQLPILGLGCWCPTQGLAMLILRFILS